MQFVWHLSYPEDLTEEPLSEAACAVGVRLLAERVEMAVPEEAVVMITDELLLGAYGLAKMTTPTHRTPLWVVHYPTLRKVVFDRAESEINADHGGANPLAGSFEYEAYRILRRRLIHWPVEQVRELIAILPELQELAVAMEPGLEDFRR